MPADCCAAVQVLKLSNVKARNYRMLNNNTQHFERSHNHSDASVCECMLHQEWKKDQLTDMSSSLVSLQAVDWVVVRYNQ